MNKAQLVSELADKLSISLSQAEKTLSAILDSIVHSLEQGQAVTLVGFGNFGVRKRAARKVRNPQSGQEMMIAAKHVPFFKAGKNLKELVASEK